MEMTLFSVSLNFKVRYTGFNKRIYYIRIQQALYIVFINTRQRACAT
jgi:hypothetical protein